MSAAVKLASKLPGEYETNGVDAIADLLVENPRSLRCAVVWFDTDKVTIDTDTDEHVPTIRVRRIEPIGHVDEVDQGVKQAVADAVERRTGRTPIPFSIVEISTSDDDDPDQLSIDDELDEDEVPS